VRTPTGARGAGFSQGATAAALLLAELAGSHPELQPAFCILVRARPSARPRRRRAVAPLCPRAGCLTCAGLPRAACGGCCPSCVGRGARMPATHREGAAGAQMCACQQRMSRGCPARSAAVLRKLATPGARQPCLLRRRGGSPRRARPTLLTRCSARGGGRWEPSCRATRPWCSACATRRTRCPRFSCTAAATRSCRWSAGAPRAAGFPGPCRGASAPRMTACVSSGYRAASP